MEAHHPQNNFVCPNLFGLRIDIDCSDLEVTFRPVTPCIVHIEETATDSITQIFMSFELIKLGNS